jgi:uncharacterized membrane protein YhaH (DUF805 family)
MIKIFFKSEGRIARLPFFGYSVITSLSVFAAVLLAAAMLDKNTAANVVAIVLMLGSIVAAGWANVVLVMKRLKDMNYSPYFVIPIMACNIFGSVITKTAPELSLALSLAVIIAYLFLLFVPGTNGDNQYGEQPK